MEKSFESIPGRYAMTFVISNILVKHRFTCSSLTLHKQALGALGCKQGFVRLVNY